MAMCNLAAFDERVVEAHFVNQKVIAGRYGPVFKSAFFVQGPVPPERVRRLYTFQTYALPSLSDGTLLDYVTEMLLTLARGH